MAERVLRFWCVYQAGYYEKRKNLRVEILKELPQEWDAFIEGHPNGWVTHLSDYKEVLEEVFPHLRGNYLVVREAASQEIRAALPLYEVTSWLLGNRLVSMPFSTLCDPLVRSGEEAKVLLEEAVRFFKQGQKSRFMEIRTLFSNDLLTDGELSVSKEYNYHYIELKGTPEELKKSFHRTCVRQRINRALSSGLILKEAEGLGDLKTFYHLYLRNRIKIGRPPQPFEYIRLLWEKMAPKGLASVQLAYRGEVCIGAMLLFRYKKQISIEFAVMHPDHVQVSPIHFLFWNAILQGFEGGFRILDFGRTSKDNKSLEKFKTQWATQSREFSYFYYPNTRSRKTEVKQKALARSAINWVGKRIPSPAFVKIGEFCYRHMA